MSQGEWQWIAEQLKDSPRYGIDLKHREPRNRLCRDLALLRLLGDVYFAGAVMVVGSGGAASAEYLS